MQDEKLQTIKKQFQEHSPQILAACEILLKVLATVLAPIHWIFAAITALLDQVIKQKKLQYQSPLITVSAIGRV